MSQDDIGNSTNNSLLGSNDDNNAQDTSSTNRDEFSRRILTHIHEVKKMLEGKGDEYVTLEKARLFRELILIVNLATIQSGGRICLDML
jgi:hypothetical protein